MGGLVNRVAWEIMEAQRDGPYREVIVEDVVAMASTRGTGDSHIL